MSKINTHENVLGPINPRPTAEIRENLLRGARYLDQWPRHRPKDKELRESCESLARALRSWERQLWRGRGLVRPTAVKNIRVTRCPKTGVSLLSMRIPVYHCSNAPHSKWVTIYTHDFGRLLADGISPHWLKLDGGPVAAPDLKTKYYIEVGCNVLGAKEGEYIDYLDGDPFNLRRDNLKLVPEITPATKFEGPYLQSANPLIPEPIAVGRRQKPKDKRVAMRLKDSALREIRKAAGIAQP